MSKITVRELVFGAIFTALISIGAFIRIPIGVIPITLQLLFVILAGLLLGGRLGGLAVLTYIIIGLTGVPVFTQGGGVAYVFHPTFGYLLGFMTAAFVAGSLTERLDNNFKNYLLSGIVGLVFVYLWGGTYLYLLSNFYLGTNMSLEKVVIYGALIFVPNDLLSCGVAAFLATKIKPTLENMKK